MRVQDNNVVVVHILSEGFPNRNHKQCCFQILSVTVPGAHEEAVLAQDLDKQGWHRVNV